MRYFVPSCDNRMLLGTHEQINSDISTGFALFNDRFECLLASEEKVMDLTLVSNFLAMRNIKKNCLDILDLDEGEKTTYPPYTELIRRSVILKDANEQCDFILAHKMVDEDRTRVLGIDVIYFQGSQKILIRCTDMKDDSIVAKYFDQDPEN
jgi:hypothetical protein